MRMRFGARSDFPGKISDHGAGEASGEAHVFNDADPITLRVLRFDVGSDDLDAGLIGCVHGGCGEVIGVAIHDEAQRFGGVPRAEVEFDPMELGEAGETYFGKIGNVLAILFGQ